MYQWGYLDSAGEGVWPSALPARTQGSQPRQWSGEALPSVAVEAPGVSKTHPHSSLLLCGRDVAPPEHLEGL